MTMICEPPRQSRRNIVAHAEGSSGTAVRMPAEEMVPSHLLDGGEVVHFAIKPSPWFILLVSLRWVAVTVLVAGLAVTDIVTASYRSYLLQLAILLAGARLGWATLDWVSRLYVLTNRRVMSIRGVFKVELFECMLDRIQNTDLSMSLGERLLRVGTIAFHTAASGGNGGTGLWRIVARPLEVHEKLREAINRARNRGGF